MKEIEPVDSNFHNWADEGKALIRMRSSLIFFFT
jgi:hypothetical protein